MALAADTTSHELQGDYATIPVIADDCIYEGAAVGINAAGYAKPLGGTDAGGFAGFARAKADNTGGDLAAINVEVRRDYHSRELAFAAAAQADVGSPIYGTADDTFQLSDTSSKYIGQIEAFPRAGYVIVAVRPHTAGP